jgi:hypothetical protein
MSSECWAAALGDCSNKITGEHIFTRGIFPQDEMFVQGLHWCRDKPKRIGLASVTAKILCSAHNSGLSEKDDVAIQTAEAFREAVALREFREKHKRMHWTRRHFQVDGYQLESWFLKTLINIAYEGPKRIGCDSIEPGQASVNLVETAFGLRRLSKPSGLYTVSKVGETNSTDGRIRAITVSHAAGHICGAIFYFGGLRYFLYLETDGSPKDKIFLGPGGQLIQDSHFLYHIRRVHFTVHGRVSHTINFKW